MENSGGIRVETFTELMVRQLKGAMVAAIIGSSIDTNSQSRNLMNESNLSDQALAELLSLTMKVNQWGANVYRNHLGQLHRVHGPAEIWADGTKKWYQNGLLHRIHGPAIIYSNGTKKWYQNGHPHRINGPATECADGRKYWFLNGELLTKHQFNERVKTL